MVDIEAVRDWLGRLPGGSLAERYTGEWDRFARHDRPVVTLFGSYDTGKSSLLRRLLVDAGAEVPGWLTISARHETFEVGEVELGGCVVRDTPGFAVGATDVRARNNTGRAMTAVALTDVGIVVLPPQLATAEHGELRRVLDRGWPAGTMWFVVSRFDEAGADPEDDPEGYGELAARKIGELRDQFRLDEGTRVFVVAQDPFQLAGPATGLGRETWDPFRDWDGMAGLADALAALSPADLPAWRRAAAQRYWTTVLDETVTELRAQLAEYTERAAVAATGVARRDSWESELDALDRAAHAGLDGLVEDVMRRSGELGAGELQTEIQRALDEWFTRHEARLQRLRQSIHKTREQDRARPDWTGFAALVATLESGTDTGPAAPGAVADHLDTVGTLLLGALKVATEAGAQTAAKKAAATWGRHLGTAEAFLPVAVHLARLVDQHRTDSAHRDHDRAAAEQRRQVVAACTSRAREAWQPFVDDIRADILAGTGDQAGLDTTLHDLVTRLRQAVTEGETLLGPQD
ncbi:hypothetical protein MB27_10950 [Actinoplanes utahensis]|uniref:G domain-containing protein n=1 Tax=Actinoplanes utahensis TaxID=1869 RepID=A0A0A6URH8_ACTUT|nr:hypothetical protein MB27_10950 [Actinoplanes utahensis]